MRVLQLIDSLRPGGAEKMAVNIANALITKVDKSFICCTRDEGLLKEQLKEEVEYLYLKKRMNLDIKAVLHLRKYIAKNKIDIVHAHSTSFFLAGLIKLSGSKITLIWHDHYGESEHIEKRKFQILKQFSSLFNGIISVNDKLKIWAQNNLYCKNVVEIKNFISDSSTSNYPFINLKGEENDLKIICVANLRPQKDHLNLLRAFEKLGLAKAVSLHLIGENPDTIYSRTILDAIKNSLVNHKIFYYGIQTDILRYLEKSDIGIIPSRSEGLPLALIEYGISGLAVISTNVGKCSEVIGENGIIVPSGNSEALTAAIKNYIDNPLKRKKESKSFQKKIKKEFSEISVISSILDFYYKVYI